MTSLVKPRGRNGGRRNIGNPARAFSGSFVSDEDTDRRIAEYQARMGISNRSLAIRALIEIAVKSLPDV